MSESIRPFTLTRMIGTTVRHSWRTSVSVALGVATATAVIVGALLVGDSMRGSLRQLTIERLGKTEVMIAPGGFFEFQGVVDSDVDPVALILFQSGVVEWKNSQDPGGAIRRASSVQIIGLRVQFLGSGRQRHASPRGPARELGRAESVDGRRTGSGDR